MHEFLMIKMEPLHFGMLPLLTIWWFVISPTSSLIDDNLSCSATPQRQGRNMARPGPDCDLETKNWCSSKTQTYPEEVLQEFILDNRGIMRRLFGDARESRNLHRDYLDNMFDFSVPPPEMPRRRKAKSKKTNRGTKSQLKTNSELKQPQDSSSSLRSGKKIDNDKARDMRLITIDVDVTKFKDALIDTDLYMGDKVKGSENLKKHFQNIDKTQDIPHQRPNDKTLLPGNVLDKETKTFFIRPTATLSTVPTVIVSTVNTNTNTQLYEEVTTDANHNVDDTNITPVQSTLEMNLDEYFPTEQTSESILPSQELHSTFNTSTSLHLIEVITIPTINVHGPSSSQPLPLDSNDELKYVSTASSNSILSQTILSQNSSSSKVKFEIPPSNNALPAVSQSKNSSKDGSLEGRVEFLLQSQKQTGHHGSSNVVSVGQVGNVGHSPQFDSNNQHVYNIRTSNNGGGDKNNNKKNSENGYGNKDRPNKHQYPSFSSREPFNACNTTSQVITPTWARNMQGKDLIVVNVGSFVQHLFVEECREDNLLRQKYCRRGCRCEQQYRMHKLLVYDPNDECKGIFSDWFMFPSCCVCKCYPSIMAKAQRNGRFQDYGEDDDYYYYDEEDDEYLDLYDEDEEFEPPLKPDTEVNEPNEAPNTSSSAALKHIPPAYEAKYQDPPVAIVQGVDIPNSSPSRLNIGTSIKRPLRRASKEKKSRLLTANIPPQMPPRRPSRPPSHVPLSHHNSRHLSIPHPPMVSPVYARFFTGFPQNIYQSAYATPRSIPAAYLTPTLLMGGVAADRHPKTLYPRPLLRGLQNGGPAVAPLENEST